MDEFIKAVEDLLDKTSAEPLEYRFHYNDAGDIYLCTMQQHPSDTQYIVVDKEIYDNYVEYKVVDGKLKLIDKRVGFSVQLKKSDSGYRVVKNHASIIVEENETYPTTEYYGNN